METDSEKQEVYLRCLDLAIRRAASLENAPVAQHIVREADEFYKAALRHPSRIERETSAQG